MACTILLVRHASHARIGQVLCGRMPGVHLDEHGLEQARRLGARLARRHPAAVYTSPLDRAHETARILADACRCPLLPCEELQEIDFGTWSGRRFDELAEDPAWVAWNEHRATSRPPGGESMSAAQTRIATALQAMLHHHPEEVLVAVSHADVIRAALLWVLGLSLDAFQRLEVFPATVSSLAIWKGGAKLLSLNEDMAG